LEKLGKSKIGFLWALGDCENDKKKKKERRRRKHVALHPGGKRETEVKARPCGGRWCGGIPEFLAKPTEELGVIDVREKGRWRRN